MSIHFFDDDIPICRWCGDVSKPGKTLKFLPWCGKKCSNRLRVALTLRCAKAIYAIRQGCTMSMAASFSGLSRERVRVIARGIIRPTAVRSGRALTTIRKIMSLIPDLTKYKIAKREMANIMVSCLKQLGFKSSSDRAIYEKTISVLRGRKSNGVQFPPKKIDYMNVELPTKVLASIWSLKSNEPVYSERERRGTTSLANAADHDVLIRKEVEMADRYYEDIRSFHDGQRTSLVQFRSDLMKACEEVKKTHWV